MAGTSPAMTNNNISVIPGWSKGPDPESRDFGFALRAPRNDAREETNHVHHHARAETDRSVRVAACRSAGTGEESWTANGTPHHRCRRRAAHDRRRGSADRKRP